MTTNKGDDKMTQFKHIMKFLGVIIAIPLGIGLLVWLGLWLGDGTDWSTLKGIGLLLVLLLMYLVACSLPLMYAVDAFDIDLRWQAIVSWVTGIMLSSFLAGLIVKQYWPNVIDVSGASNWSEGIIYMIGYGLFVLILIYTAILAVACLALVGALIFLLLKEIWDKTR